METAGSERHLALCLRRWLLRNTVLQLIVYTGQEVTHLLLQLRWSGRFGNRLFQYAYGATYARLTGLEYWLPSEWEGTRLFRQQNHRVVENDEIRLALTSPDEGAASNQQRMQAVQKYYPDAELIDAELASEPVREARSSTLSCEWMLLQPAIFARMSKGHI